MSNFGWNQQLGRRQGFLKVKLDGRNYSVDRLNFVSDQRQGVGQLILLIALFYRFVAGRYILRSKRARVPIFDGQYYMYVTDMACNLSGRSAVGKCYVTCGTTIQPRKACQTIFPSRWNYFTGRGAVLEQLHAERQMRWWLTSWAFHLACAVGNLLITAREKWHLVRKAPC